MLAVSIISIIFINLLGGFYFITQRLVTANMVQWKIVIWSLCLGCWYTDSKTPGMPWVVQMSFVGLWDHLWLEAWIALGREVLITKTKAWAGVWGWNTQPHPLTSRDGRGAHNWVNLIANDQGFNQSFLQNETPIITTEQQSSDGPLNSEILRGWCTQRRMEALHH